MLYFFGQMPEEYEVLGGNNDQQMMVDTDPLVNKWTALISLVGAGVALTGFYQLLKATHPETKNPAVSFFVFSVLVYSLTSFPDLLASNRHLDKCRSTICTRSWAVTQTRRLPRSLCIRPDSGRVSHFINNFLNHFAVFAAVAS
jgi:hypothetical protein